MVRCLLALVCLLGLAAVAEAGHCAIFGRVRERAVSRERHVERGRAHGSGPAMTGAGCAGSTMMAPVGSGCTGYTGPPFVVVPPPGKAPEPMPPKK